MEVFALCPQGLSPAVLVADSLVFQAPAAGRSACPASRLHRWRHRQDAVLPLAMTVVGQGLRRCGGNPGAGAEPMPTCRPCLWIARARGRKLHRAGSPFPCGARHLAPQLLRPEPTAALRWVLSLGPPWP